MSLYILKKDVHINQNRFDLLKEVRNQFSDESIQKRIEKVIERIRSTENSLHTKGYMEITEEDVLYLSDGLNSFTYVFSIKKGADFLTKEELDAFIVKK